MLVYEIKRIYLCKKRRCIDLDIITKKSDIILRMKKMYGNGIQYEAKKMQKIVNSLVDII